MVATPYIGLCEFGGFELPLADTMVQSGHAGADVGSRARAQAEHDCQDGALNLQNYRARLRHP